MTAALPPRGEDVELAALGRRGQRLGSPGGQGWVEELLDIPGFVVKFYDRAFQADLVSLRALAAWPLSLSSGELTYLDDLTSWPRNPVLDGGRCVGVVLARIPKRFYAPRQGGSIECQLQHLCCSKRRLEKVDGVPFASATERVAICASYARFVAFLHDHDVVLGDINWKNQLWSLGPGGVTVYSIDCDSARREGYGSVLPIVEAPGWVDPRAKGVTSKSSDCYKLGLAIVRILAMESGSLEPGYASWEHSALQQRIGPDLADRAIEISNAPVDRRPTPGAWLMSLGSGNATLAVSTPTAGARPILPLRSPRRTMLRGANQARRPVITLKNQTTQSVIGVPRNVSRFRRAWRRALGWLTLFKVRLAKSRNQVQRRSQDSWAAAGRHPVMTGAGAAGFVLLLAWMAGLVGLTLMVLALACGAGVAMLAKRSR
jgi:hypothetical protein